LTQRGQNVVRSNSRCHVPNNHSKYGTATRYRVYGTPVKLQGDDPGPRIHAPDPLWRKPFHLYSGGGHERSARCFHRVTARPVQCHPPLGDLQIISQAAGPHLGNIDHIEPFGHRRVEPFADIAWTARRSQRNLEVLRLAGHAGWHRACVGNLRVGGEAT
jgi:hypothetical protein